MGRGKGISRCESHCLYNHLYNMHRPEYSVLRCNVIPANPRTDSVAGLPMCNALSNSLQQQFWEQIVMFQHWHTETQKELAYCHRAIFHAHFSTVFTTLSLIHSFTSFTFPLLSLFSTSLSHYQLAIRLMTFTNFNDLMTSFYSYSSFTLFHSKK